MMEDVTQKSAFSRALDATDPWAERIGWYSVLFVVFSGIISAALTRAAAIGLAWSAALVLAVVLASVVGAVVVHRRRRNPDPVATDDAPALDPPIRAESERHGAADPVAVSRPTARSYRPAYDDPGLADRLQSLHDEGDDLLTRCHLTTVSLMVMAGQVQPDEFEVSAWVRQVEDELRAYPVLLSRFRRKPPPAPWTGMTSHMLMSETHRELSTRMDHLTEVIAGLHRVDA